MSATPSPRAQPPIDLFYPLQRAAIWRAARSGLEGTLLDLPRSSQPVPAPAAVASLLEHLHPQLEAAGDWEYVSDLAERAHRAVAARPHSSSERSGGEAV